LVANPAPHERAFSMMVSITKGSNPISLFLVEQKGGNVAGKIAVRKILVPPPGSDGNTCSVER
jgi:hypothetical protein